MYNDEPYYFRKNLQGDIVAIVDKNAATVARYAYDAWGVPTITQDSSACQIATINPYRYRGYYYDEEIGIYYLQSRYYDPTVGRWLSPEPNVYKGEFDEAAGLIRYDVYAYCANSPIIYKDEFGESITAILIGIGIGALLGALAGWGYTKYFKIPKSKSWKYILGGAVIGAVIGGCIGYAVGGSCGSGIVLWSGGGTKGAGGYAAKFAAKNGLKTLEMTTKGKLLSKINNVAIKLLGETRGYKFMRPLWNAASKQFVKSAVGKQTYVHVFIKVSQFSSNSVFAKIEYQVIRSLGLKIIWHLLE